MPPKSSKSSKNAPNQHDKRHESGLAPPGKRVIKQRSNGQLNGSTHPGKSAAAVAPPQLPSTGLNQGIKFPRSADATAENAFGAVARDYATATEGMERDRTTSDASVDDTACYAETADNYYNPISATMDGSAATGKPGQFPAGTAIRTVSTILPNYPLRDAISILILLISLPPTLVLVIQGLFASLTFVPPTAGLFPSAIPNLKDVLNANTITAPALWTILVVDILIGLLWMAVWKPVQNIFLDLSQAAIAVSLSGAAASTSGPTYSVTVCILLVCAFHVLRYKAIDLTAFDYLRSVLLKMGFRVPPDISFYVPSFVSPPPTEGGWVPTVFRTILGIHIVSQGVTTCVRYSLVKNKKDQTLPLGSKTDPEANAGSDGTPRGAIQTDSASQLHSVSTSTDGRHPGPPPARRDSKSRDLSKSKKRKQANQARSEQPLWAAIASTKLTFHKEIEQREAALDAREVAAMEKDASSALSVITQCPGRIWFRDTTPTEIHLFVDLAEDATIRAAQPADTSCNLPSGVDKSKPFFIRINGTTWTSTRIELDNPARNAAHADGRYECVIFGLAPRGNYQCDIISVATRAVVDSARFITPDAPNTEQSISAQIPQSQIFRPSSPSSTLQQSIRTSQAAVNEVKNQLKKQGKASRAQVADLKKEVQQLKNKLETSGGQDGKANQRIVQVQQHINAAEEGIAELKTKLEDLGEIPADELADADIKRRAWQLTGDKKDAALKDYESAKHQQDRELASIRNEIAAAESKQDKLMARRIQRDTDLEKLAEQEQAELSLKAQREFERSQETLLREKHESDLQRQVSILENESQSWRFKSADVMQQIAALQGFPSYSSPSTPENALPSLANGSSSNGFVAPHFPSNYDLSQPSVAPMFANPNCSARARSSSMLSQVSGFTNDEDFIQQPFEPRQQYSWPLVPNTNPFTPAAVAPTALPVGEPQPMLEGDGEGSGYGGSLTNGSTNGSNSPRPEAKVFVPAAGLAVHHSHKSPGTIGPPGKKAAAAAANAIGNGR